MYAVFVHMLATCSFIPNLVDFVFDLQAFIINTFLRCHAFCLFKPIEAEKTTN